MALSDIIIIGLTLFGLLGVILGIIGWGGRRVGDHPHCISCGFDLTGLTNPLRCPECGESLQAIGRVATGQFERRWTPLLIGLLLIVPGACLLAYSLLGEVQGTPWIQREPTWYLMRTMNPGEYGNPGPEVSELIRRVTSGGLNNEQIAGIARQLIDRQQNPQAKWHHAMSDLIEKAYALGALSDEDWSRYLFDISPLRLTVRPLTQSGDPIAAELEKQNDRVSQSHYPVLLTIQSMHLDDQALPLPLPFSGEIRAAAPLRQRFAIDQKITPGEHLLGMTVRIEISNRISPGGPSTVSRTYTCTQAFRVADDAKTLLPRSDATRVEHYRKELTPGYFNRKQRKRIEGVERVGERTVSLSFDVDQALHPAAERCGLAFDVFIESDHVETLVDHLNFDANVSFGYGFSVGNIPPQVTRLHVILKPSRDAAVRNVDITNWLDAQFDYDVPIVSRD